MRTYRLLLTSLAGLALALPSSAASGLGVDSGAAFPNAFRNAWALRQNLMLPPTGTGAALANPARLGEAEHWTALLGYGSGGNVSAFGTNAGIGICKRLYLGLATFQVDGQQHGTNAVFNEAEYSGQIAYRFALDSSGAMLSIGYALDFHKVDPFGYFTASQFNHDFGLVLVPPSFRGWRANLGCALHNPVPFDIESPNGYRLLDGGPGSLSFVYGVDTTYRLYSWNAEAALALSVPGRHWSAHAMMAAFGRNHNAYPEAAPEGRGIGPDGFMVAVRRYGIEYLPSRYARARLERLWNRYWQFGGTLSLSPLLRWNLEADGNLAYGPLKEYIANPISAGFDPARKGWVASSALRAGW